MAKAPCTTKTKLIDAAHSLIWANSYAHVSVEDICRQAGVQKGSFYHFFDSKAALAAAALEDHWQEVKPKLDAIVANHTTAREQLRALAREILNKQRTALETSGVVCGCPYATVASELSTTNERLRAISSQMSERFSGYFETILRHAAREGRIPARGIKARAQQMHIYAIGAMMQSRIMNTLDPVGTSFEKGLMQLAGMGE